MAPPSNQQFPEEHGLLGSYRLERSIELKIDGNMPTYWGDQLRLLEVFQNLIENAAKFMGDQPSLCIEISAELNGEMIVCKVKDNGIGIDPVYHARIFNLFERLNPKIDGTGIGMALVKRIIEAHGGAITVESNGDQQGSSFIFTLPEKPFDDANSQNSVTVQ